MGMEPVFQRSSTPATPERKLQQAASTPDRKLQQQPIAGTPGTPERRVPANVGTPEGKFPQQQQQLLSASTPERKQMQAVVGTPERRLSGGAGTPGAIPERKFQQGGGTTPERKFQQAGGATPDRKLSGSTPERRLSGGSATPERRLSGGLTPDRKVAVTPDRKEGNGDIVSVVKNGVKKKAPSPKMNSSATPLLRSTSPSVSRRKVGRRTSFKKAGSLKTGSRKDSGEGTVLDEETSPSKKKNVGSSGESSEEEEDEGKLKQGPWFLKLAKTYHAQGDNPVKAFQFASRALQCFEKSADGRSSLDLVVSLHILAALQCRQGRFEEAVGLLKRSLDIPNLDAGMEHVLATFAGQMQLGDTLNLQGKHQLGLGSYQSALQVQKQALGDLDIRVAETCRYVAEAHLQAMQFDEAGELCELALKIHQEKSTPGSVEEAADRRLMGLVCSGKGEHDEALEHLVLASTVLLTNGLETDVASVDASIGDTLFALGRDTEAALSYQKALTALKATKGENHAMVASVLVRLGELYMKTGKPREARTHCESALRIIGIPGAGHAVEDIVYGLTDVAGIYVMMSERDQAISLLTRAVEIQGSAPGQVYTVAGVEAQLGILYYMAGKFSQALVSLKSSVAKLKVAGDGKATHFLGLMLNQLGLTLVEVEELQEATFALEESKTVIADAVGPQHPDTLSVCSNLAGTYDALGRTYEAITLLESVLDIKEDKFGSVHPEVENDRRRLMQLLKDVGRSRTRKVNTLEELLAMAKLESSRR